MLWQCEKGLSGKTSLKLVNDLQICSFVFCTGSKYIYLTFALCECVNIIIVKCHLSQYSSVLSTHTVMN